MLDRFNRLVLDLYSRLQLRREEGQGTVEYALLRAVIVGGVAFAVTGLGAAIGDKIGKVSDTLSP
jgi:Flp pilus assembly pilin Flp